MAARFAPSALELASTSLAALEATTEPRLCLAWPQTEALLLGAFQRPCEVAELDPVSPRLRRGSGGGAARVGPGVLYVGLALPHPGALMPATCEQILNRAVRPLLRALTRVSVPVHYFGRDWLSAGKCPIALATFGHDSRTRRTLVEAFVSVTALALPQPERTSYGGRAPTTLAALAGRPPDPARLEAAIAEAYGLAPEPGAALDDDPCAAQMAPEPPWQVRVEEAIGPVFSGMDARGRVRIGGEWMASRDRVAWLEAQVAAQVEEGFTDAELGARVDAAFPGAGIALFGVRSLASLQAALRGALDAPAAPAPHRAL